jgi:hypothetical protein
MCCMSKIGAPGEGPGSDPVSSRGAPALQERPARRYDAKLFIYRYLEVTSYALHEHNNGSRARRASTVIARSHRASKTPVFRRASATRRSTGS